MKMPICRKIEVGPIEISGLITMFAEINVDLNVGKQKENKSLIGT